MDQHDDQTEAERTREIHLSMDLILRIGEMLLSSGAGAADVTASMRSVADHLGLRQAEVDVTFTALSMSHQRSLDDVPILMMRHVQQREQAGSLWRFLWRYLLQVARHGYRDAPFEVDARAAAHSVVAGGP